MTNMHQNLKNNQRGVVSIMVTMIMMLVISLIVLGFSQVARRNQREALDRQLSTQAYYSAETGVNDATTAIQGGAITDLYTNPTYGKNCGAFSSALGAAKATLNTSTGAEYTCLLVNPSPDTLVGQLSLGGQLVWPLANNGGTNIRILTFTWAEDSAATATQKATACTAVGLLPATSWPCSYGILRADIVKTSAGAVSQAALTDNTGTGTTFMVPATSTVAQPFSYAGQYDRVKCAGGTCKFTLTMPGDSSSYYARLTTQYLSTDSVSISGTDVGGSTLHFTGAQAVVDSTGKAQDELRRLQVRVPLTGSSLLPLNALQSTASICKYFSTGAGYATADYSADTSASCKYQ